MALACGVRIWLAVWLAVLAVPGLARADDLAVVEASYGDGIWVRPTEALEFRLSRLPEPVEGRLVVFVGPRDVSALLRLDGNRVRYEPFFEPHVGNPREVAIFLVTGDDRWIEIDRRPLQVGRPPVLEELFEDAGLEESQIDPYFDVAAVSQVVEHSNDAFGDPPRHLFVKGSAQAGWTSRHVGHGFEATSSANFVGATFKEEALRFAERGRTAPRFDLSDFLVDVRRDRGSVQVGHIAYGNQRHLMSGFASRGVQANLLLHPRVDLSAVALSGTRIVGYDNLSGLSKSDNRIGAATVGLQLLQDDRASARLEGTWMSGSRRSQDDFNVGQITDAEKNLGYGVRFLGDFLGRIHADASWATSRFDNPVDPEQSIGGLEFAGESSWDDAVYADLALDLLRDFPLGNERFANLAVRGTYERIDPLFKSLGAFTFSDTETIQTGVVAELAGMIVSAQHTIFEDNLDDLDQILKTRSKDTLITVELPLANQLASEDRPIFWLPAVSYRFDHLHEYGANTPDAGSGFSPSAIPDQVTEQHDAVLSWTYGLASLSYRYSWSFQDNRQPGREDADFRDQTHGLDASFHIDLADGLDVALGAARTQQWSRAAKIKRRTLDADASFDWRFFTHWAVSGSYFYTRETDSQNLAKSKSRSLDGQLSYAFSVPLPGQRTMPGRIYVRASRQSTRFEDSQFGFSQRPRQWTLLVGTSITLF